MNEGTEKNSKQSKTAVEKQESNMRFQSGTGNVGFATPGLSATTVPIRNANMATAVQKNGKRQDRYAQDGKLDDINSEIAEEDLKYLINSPAPKSREADSMKQLKMGEKLEMHQEKAYPNQNEFVKSDNQQQEQNPKQSPKFGDDRMITFEQNTKGADAGVNPKKQKANEQPLKLQMSKISQEDIQNRNTFEEIEKDDKNNDKRKNNAAANQERGFNSSEMSMQEGPATAKQPIQNVDTSVHKKAHSITQSKEQTREVTAAPADTVVVAARAAEAEAQKAADANAEKNRGRSPKRSPQVDKEKTLRRDQKAEPEINPLAMETERLQKLENMKEYVQFKKVVEYESETIELYEMISNEFDYEELRKESPNFNIKQYKDSIYRGEINKKRKRHGKGVIVYDTGRIYEGDWGTDKREGRGFELFSNGNTFQGEYQNGKAHGKGAYTWRNGEAYDGEWVGGQKCGYGVWRGIHGDSYIGQWADSKAEGYGVHTWLDGDRYEGEWKACLRHGNGTDFFANGDMYIGQYEDGKPSGFGQYKWVNGNSYTGEFKIGQKHGKGKWKKKASNPLERNRFNQYDGYYEMDKKHGYGQFQWESGNRYTGNYHRDERQGYGTMEWTDGSKYKGYWVKGTQHGVGIMIFPDGVKRAGFFESNIFQLPLKDEHQIEDLVDDMPEDILNELIEYIEQRKRRIAQMKEEGLDVQSQMLESEQDYMGQEFKPPVDQEEPVEGDNDLKMIKQQEMHEVGKQINANQENEHFVNHLGLKRVYRPKNSKNFDIQPQPEVQPTQQVNDQTFDEQPKVVNDQRNTEIQPLAQNPQAEHHQNAQPFQPFQSTSLQHENRQDYDKNEEGHFHARKHSVTKNTQTELQMDTIQRYEQSALTAAGGSSVGQGASYYVSNYYRYPEDERGRPKPGQSDFGQMFQASKEFPNFTKKNIHNLDQSMTFTDVDMKNTRKEKQREIEKQKGEARNQYINGGDRASTSMERHHLDPDRDGYSNLTRKTNDVGVQKFIPQKSKTIQTKPNQRSPANQFLMNTKPEMNTAQGTPDDDLKTSLDGSDALSDPRQAQQQTKKQKRKEHKSRRRGQDQSWFDENNQQQPVDGPRTSTEADEAKQVTSHARGQQQNQRAQRRQDNVRKPSNKKKKQRSSSPQENENSESVDSESASGQDQSAVSEQSFSQKQHTERRQKAHNKHQNKEKAHSKHNQQKREHVDRHHTEEASKKHKQKTKVENKHHEEEEDIDVIKINKHEKRVNNQYIEEEDNITHIKKIKNVNKTEIIDSQEDAVTDVRRARNSKKEEMVHDDQQNLASVKKSRRTKKAEIVDEDEENMTSVKKQKHSKKAGDDEENLTSLKRQTKQIKSELIYDDEDNMVSLKKQKNKRNAEIDYQEEEDAAQVQQHRMKENATLEYDDEQSVGNIQKYRMRAKADTQTGEQKAKKESLKRHNKKAQLIYEDDEEEEEQAQAKQKKQKQKKREQILASEEDQLNQTSKYRQHRRDERQDEVISSSDIERAAASQKKKSKKDKKAHVQYDEEYDEEIVDDEDEIGREEEGQSLAKRKTYDTSNEVNAAEHLKKKKEQQRHILNQFYEPDSAAVALQTNTPQSVYRYEPHIYEGQQKERLQVDSSPQSSKMEQYQTQTSVPQSNQYNVDSLPQSHLDTIPMSKNDEYSLTPLRHSKVIDTIQDTRSQSHHYDEESAQYIRRHREKSNNRALQTLYNQEFRTYSKHLNKRPSSKQKQNQTQRPERGGYIRSEVQDDGMYEDDKSSNGSNKLPMIHQPAYNRSGKTIDQDEQRMTGGFKQAFYKAQTETISRQRRNKFMDHLKTETNFDVIDDDESEENDGNLRFHDFELRPRIMAETSYHMPNPRMHDLELLQQMQQSTYFGGGQSNQRLPAFYESTNPNSSANIQLQMQSNRDLQNIAENTFNPSLQQLQTLQQRESSNQNMQNMPSNQQMENIVNTPTLQQNQQQSDQNEQSDQNNQIEQSPSPQLQSISYPTDNVQASLQNQIVNYQHQLGMGSGQGKKKKRRRAGNRSMNPQLRKKSKSPNPIRNAVIKIGTDDRRQNGSVAIPSNLSNLKPQLAGLRIAPQSYLSGRSQVDAVKSARNRIAQIYNIKGKGSKNSNLPSTIFSSMQNQIQSVATDATLARKNNQSIVSPPVNNSMAANQALGMVSDTNQLDYTSGAGSGAEMPNAPRIGGLPVNKIGLQNLRKRKIIPGPNSSTLAAEAAPTAQLPPLAPQPLNLLQSNNSIQAIDVSNQNIASGDLADYSPDKYDDTNVVMRTKKKRKKVWIPAESFRKLGL